MRNAIVEKGVVVNVILGEIDGSIPCPEEVGIGWTYDGSSFAPPERANQTLAVLKQEKVAAITAKTEEATAAGVKIGQFTVAMDDASRADLGGMAVTALAAASGALPWPESYRQGWISKENKRIPMETPQDGLTLAAAVGDQYATIRQNGRTLKDAAESAGTKAALEAVDINAGWPA